MLDYYICKGPVKTIYRAVNIQSVGVILVMLV